MPAATSGHRSAVLRYGTAAALVGFALTVRLLFGDTLGLSVPYLQFVPVVMLASLYGGFGPGLTATALSAIAAAYWFLEPSQSLPIRNPGDILSWELFVVVGVLIAWLAEKFRRAEARQRQLADRLARQYRALPIPTFSYEWNGDDFTLVDLNDAATQLRGDLGRSFPEQRPNLLACLTSRGSFVRDAECQVPGEAHPRYVVGRYSFAPPNLVTVHLEDVTSRRVADLAKEQLAAIVQSSDDAIISKDLDGVITSWNRAAERSFGYTQAEAIGQPITLIIPPDRRAEQNDVLGRVREGRIVPPFETVRLRKDGSRIEMSTTVSPIRSAAGGVVGVSMIARDISDRRRADRIREELLRRETDARAEAVTARDRLAFLAEVSVLLASLDYEETLDRAVHLALPQLGDYSNMLVQDDAGALRHVACGHVVPEKEPIVRALATRILEHGEGRPPTLAEEVMKRRQTLVVNDIQARVPVAAWQQTDPDLIRLADQLRVRAYIGAPLMVRGRPIGVISFGRTLLESNRGYDDADIMLLEEFARRVSMAIENARLFKQADELNRLKDEFLATLSHELRTPLSAILGWSRLLVSPQLGEEGRAKAVQAIERNALAQTKLVDDILDVARGMAGNVRLELVRTDLATIAARGVEAITPAASAKAIALELRAPERAIVIGDPARLQQVVWNLLSNAVKFTPADGRVRVEVTKAGGSAELRVIDSGIGIPKNFLPRVFDKFRQANASFSREYGGLGLGLAIARHLIELHGGTVDAHSEGEGLGSTFIIRVPLASGDPGV